MALNAAIQSPPDLFLLDILMPDMNGYELCKKLQENENTRGIPVIFLSALNEINDKIKTFKTGVSILFQNHINLPKYLYEFKPT